MKVELLNYTPLHIAAKAIRTCWDSHEHSDTEFHERGENDIIPKVYIMGDNDKALIDRVGNKFKHSSTLEHLSYNFYIKGISRACLQELARHRMTSLSVKSTRYTLKELKNEAYLYNTNQAEGLTWHWDLIEKYCVLTNNTQTDVYIAKALSNLKDLLEDGISNDIAKYALPESYKTELTWTINARSLQNFLSLRSAKSALWEIRDLANAIYQALPTDHKYLFSDCLAQNVQSPD